MSAEALQFASDGAMLHGILDRAAPAARTAVLIIVGGPQYRVGSHRQFTLLARALAAAGHTTLRFDFSGMGDSEGEPLGFEQAAGDLGAALDALLAAEPAARRVAVWGLCDAASAALLHVAGDPRVCGLALLNPWVRTNELASQAIVTHYYRRRFADLDAWREVLKSGTKLRAAAASLAGNVARSLRRLVRREENATLPARMLRGAQLLRGPMLLVLSGDDLTAAEFRTVAGRSSGWRRLLARPDVERRELAAANHTFSKREWREQVERWTIEWLQRIDSAAS